MGINITLMHFISALPMWTIKLTSIIVGYLVVRLGYNLLMAGVKGEFTFTSDMKGIKAGLASTSPGLLFLLLGVILMIYAVSPTTSFQTTIPTKETTAEKPEVGF